ncbi:adaptive-response sensory-kinase SasA [Cyanobium sp. PCC 7001]|uniref:histidine kinase n=1 Tax=Cyanobium sp. PCC 7001 TaxID=180281 RepID=UPI000180518A|nr:histidine kinase [Cyanobium sp. PCC 7001]EDY38689.1 adaptive-response sensory-kinase SasA [Cyanobium sp. PCC 7001]
MSQTPSPTSAPGGERQALRLLLVATRQQLAGQDLRTLLQLLKRDDLGFEVTLEVADPRRQPELLELHRLLATPALVKLAPAPKQVFAGSPISQRLQNWLPRWQQLAVVNDLGIQAETIDMEAHHSRRELQLEDQLLVLRQENEALIERIGVQERLLRMVAHELRTPLTAAKLALQSHRLGQIDERRYQEVVGRRLDDIEELSKDLLEVGTTRWEALFNPKRLSLGKLAAEAILELEKLWVGRSLRLITDIPADLPDVYGDERRLRQVLLNLLENAFKYTPERGEVTLTLLHRTDQWVQLSVGDSGPGIPAEQQQRIFLERVRLPQTADTTSGYGVGLSVCRRIAEVHGGRIWVVSEPGEGACFHVTVPVWSGQGQSALTKGHPGP